MMRFVTILLLAICLLPSRASADRPVATVNPAVSQRHNSAGRVAT